MGSMTKDEINVSLFDEVKALRAEIEQKQQVIDALPPLETVVRLVEQRDKLKAALRQSYLDNGCRMEEAEEMVDAFIDPAPLPQTTKDKKPFNRLHWKRDMIAKAKELGWVYTPIELVDAGQAYGYESPDKTRFLTLEELVQEMSQTDKIKLSPGQYECEGCGQIAAFGHQCDL